MHICCSVLLFFSLLSCRNASGTAINLSSFLRILSVPIYIAVLFRAEQAIRKYRTVYAGETSSQLNNFVFASWKDAKKTSGPASTCFFNENGTGIFWLWIELYAFLGQILSILLDLINSYFSNPVIQEPKNSDYIFVKDYREIN
jgi:hypothetical protein